MGFDTSVRVGLVFGVAAALSWLLFAEDDLASPVNSLVAGVLGFTIAYAITSLIAEVMEEHSNQACRRGRSASTNSARRKREQDENQD